MLALASVHAAAAVDRVTDEEAAVAAARARAEQAVERIKRGLDRQARKPFARALRQLEADELPELDACAAELDGLRAAHAARAAAQSDADTAMAREADRLAGELRAIAADPRFREAVLWQNRGAVATALDRVRDGRPTGPAKHREHELLVARYLQRYCTKNDTIGFFGPLGWATLAEDEAGAALDPGPDLLARRTVSFEQWAIHALALELARDPAVREHLAPRRSPTRRLPDGSPSSLSREVLAACDGVRSAREIARELGDDAHDILEELAAHELVIWELELPSVAELDVLLRRRLVAMGSAGGAGIAALDRLDAGRDRVVEAAGDPPRLADALAGLDATFTAVAATGATRRAGETYAARTIVYEDCRRDLAMRLGPSLVRRIARPLALVLDSARWYTWELASRYERMLDRVYRELGSAPVDYARYIDRLHDERTEDIGREVTDELAARWREVLACAPDARRVDRRAGELEARVAAAFAAPHPGWAGARLQELDLLVTARSFEDALHRGVVVLGELHPATSNAMRPMFMRDCPYAEEMLAAYERDVNGPGVTPVMPRALVTRGISLCPLARGYDIEIGTTISARPRDRTLAAADLIVEAAADRLWARTRDGTRRFPLNALFEYPMMAMTGFRLLPHDDHVPRVTIDDLVVQREQWVVDGHGLRVDAVARSVEQFRAVRAWARDLGLPRFAFAKVADEAKPFFVDFASPIYVDSFVRLARDDRRVVISEMLPSIEDVWLRDAGGDRYTCELRLTAVDPRSWPEPVP